MKLNEQQVKTLMPDNRNWEEWVEPMQDLFGKYVAIASGSESWRKAVVAAWATNVARR